MMNLAMAFGITAGVIWVYMSLFFGLALVARRNDIADVAWGLGFIVVSIANRFMGGPATALTTVLFVLVVLWGLRLAVHIHMRNRDQGEDYRYKAWREEWGENFIRRTYLQVFMLQGLFMWMISFPLIIGHNRVGPGLNWLDAVGILVWVVGFVTEAVGDYQLLVFKRDPENKGQLMTSELWRYSRHPNYFGEVVQWWGIFLIALSVPRGWLGIVGPLTITILITKVSGIPMLEEKSSDKPGWDAYARRTSVFVPWFPKNE